jgi:hypothetical protein
MNRLVCVALLLAGVSGKLHIDIQGNDEFGDGSAARPWRTLERAKREQHASFDLELAFGPGLHFLPAGGLHLGAAESGTKVTGAGMDSTFLSGATQITEWTESPLPSSKLRLWTAKLNRSESTLLMQLFVQEEGGLNFSRRVVARSPLMHYNHSSAVDPKYAIVYENGQVANSYHNQEDVLATLYHCWTATTHRIRSIAPKNNTLTLLQAPHVDIPRCEHASGKRFYLQNARELLTQHGQFYYDRGTSELLYVPLPNERDPKNFTAFAPTMVTLLDVNGGKVNGTQSNRHRNTLVNGITVSDLSLVHAAADMDGFFKGDCDGQAASNLKTAAVQVTNAGEEKNQQKFIRRTNKFIRRTNRYNNALTHL